MPVEKLCFVVEWERGLRADYDNYVTVSKPPRWYVLPTLHSCLNQNWQNLRILRIKPN